MKLSDIKNDHTINIFTDGSMKFNMGINNISVGCAGAIIVTPVGTTHYTKIIEDCTNNVAELMAIHLGVSMLLRNHPYQKYKVNLFSDSLISINSLKEWVYNWKINKNGYLINSSGKPVVNQEILTHIVHLICTSNMGYTLYHQKGHINNNSLTKGLMTFKKTNGIKDYIDMEVIKYISNYNDIIDTLTRNELVGYELQNKTVHHPYSFVVTDTMKKNLFNRTNAKTNSAPYYIIGGDGKDE